MWVTGLCWPPSRRPVDDLASGERPGVESGDSLREIERRARLLADFSTVLRVLYYFNVCDTFFTR